jgi:hypothetical protein
VLVATAHAAKFEAIVEPLRMEAIEVPFSLKTLLDRNSSFSEVGSNLIELSQLYSK